MQDIAVVDDAVDQIERVGRGLGNHLAQIARGCEQNVGENESMQAPCSRR